MSALRPDNPASTGWAPNTPLTATQLRWLSGLLLLSLLLRLIAAFGIDLYVQQAGRQFLVEGDANGYWELAQHLAHGEDYAIHSPPRRILRTPGFPLLLAASIRLFGDSITVASLVLATVGSLCCLQLFVLTRRLAGTGPAIVALAIAAVSPLQIATSVQILSEGWFTCWVLASLLTLEPLLRQAPGHPERHPLLQALLAGVAAGIGTLVRPGWILWPVVASILLLWLHRDRLRQRVLLAGLLCLAAWLTLLPWAARNYHVSGLWVHTSLWSGPSLYDGLNPGATGASDMRFLDAEGLYQRFSEAEVNEQYKQRAVEFVLKNPQRTLQLAFTKMLRFLSPTLHAPGLAFPLLNVFLGIWYVFLGFLTIQGLFANRISLSSRLLLILPFLQFLAVHMVFVGSVRYRLPVEMPLMTVAACGLVALLSKRGRRLQP